MNTNNLSAQKDQPPYAIWGPLLFSSFYFLPPLLFGVESLLLFFIIVFIYSLFIALYIKSTAMPGDLVLPWLLLMLVVVVIGSYFTSGTQSLFGYIAYIAGFNLTFKKSLPIFMCITASIIASALILLSEPKIFLYTGLFINTVLFIFSCYARLDAIHRRKTQQSDKTIEQLAAIAERERIARDLHDVIGHSLSSIALKSELADKYIHKKLYDKAQVEISGVAHLSRDILSEVRHTVSGLKKLDLSSAVNKLTNELENHNFSVVVSNPLSQLNAVVESTIVFILTEAITNILRHSQGDRVLLQMAQENDVIHIKINDNGNVKDVKQGNGLLGISERCKALKGSLVIDCTSGFTLSIALPVGPKND